MYVWGAGVGGWIWAMGGLGWSLELDVIDIIISSHQLSLRI